MNTPNRREYILLAGSTATAVLAGCSGGGDDPTTDTQNGTATPTSTESRGPGVLASGGDTNVTLAIDSRTDDFETLVVDIDRVVCIGDSETDDVTVRIADTGLDLTTLSDGGKTYLENVPFPSGTYTGFDFYVTVQESTLSDGASATFDYEPPVSRESTYEISDDQYQNFTFRLSPRYDFTEDTYEISVTGVVATGAP